MKRPRLITVCCLLSVIAVSQHAQWYRHDARAMIDAEQMNVWSGLDFVLGFVYQLDQSGYPVRPFWNRLSGGRIPPLEVRSPHPNAPYVPARDLVLLSPEQQEAFKPYSRYYPSSEAASLRPFEVKVFRPMGGNLDVPYPGRTFRGLPKTFHNIGIQCNGPTSPYYFISGLLTVFLGKDVTNFSLNLLDPVIASRLLNMVLGTLTAVAVFAFTWAITGLHGPALAAGLFQALEPISLAESRTNKTDTSVAFLSFLTILLYWLGSESGQRRLKRFAGIVYGLALLSKVQAFLVPFVLIAWKACLRWFRRDFGPLQRLRLLAVAGLIGLLAISTVIVPLWKVVPSRIAAHMGGDLGFAINILGSLLFLALLFAACLFPIHRMAEAFLWLGAWLKGSAANPRPAKRLAIWRGMIDRDDLWFIALAAVVFFVGYPNLWGNPLGGLARHLGFLGGINPFRMWFFITPTLYLPIYYYFLMLPLHAHPLYLAAIIIGAVTAVGILRTEPLETSRRARGLLLILGWIIGYIVMTSVGGAYKKMMIATSFFPWLSVLAGIGLTAAIQWISTRWLRRSGARLNVNGSQGRLALLCGLLIVISVAPPVLSRAPYFHLYTSPFLGSPDRLRQIDWISHDSVNGYERLVDYLRASNLEGEPIAALGGAYNLSFLYPWTLYGDVMQPADLEHTGCRYVAVHVQDKQRQPKLPLIHYVEGRQPVHTVIVNGIEVIWLYAVEH